MIKRLFIICIAAFMSGCAAMLVPETSDPREKLHWAAELIDKQQRPLPAEKLIREAIEICENTNDFSCLGQAHVTYGFFFRSDALNKWEQFYRKNGFMDKKADLDSRYTVSIEYFKKGIEYYKKTNEYDALTNAYLNLGFGYYFSGDHKMECEPYRKSLESYQLNIQNNPDANPVLPKGYSSFEAYIQEQKQRAGCKQA